MATSETFTRCFALIESVYDKRIDAQRRAAYMFLLESVPDDLLINATKHACTRVKFVPTPAELMEAIKDIQVWSYNIPTAAAAWQEVVEAPAPRKVKTVCDEGRRLTAIISGLNTKAENYTAAYGNAMKSLIVHDRTCEQCQTEMMIMPTFSHPIIEHIARRLGWPDLFWSDNLGVDRGRFIQTYDNEVKNMSARASTLPDVREYIEQRQDDRDEIRRMFASEATDRGERMLADLVSSKRM